MSNLITPPPSDADADLSATQRVRWMMVGKLTRNNTCPEDPKEIKAVAALLDGIDRQILTIKKIQSDEGISNNQLAAAGIISQLFGDPRSKMSAQPPTTEEGLKRSIPVLDESAIEPQVVVPGELGGQGSQETYKDFMARMNSAVKVTK